MKAAKRKRIKEARHDRSESVRIGRPDVLGDAARERLPAYLALAAATGSGCYAVAVLIASGTFTFAIHCALATVLLISFALHCEAAPIRILGRLGRAFMLLVGLPLGIYTFMQAISSDTIITGGLEANSSVAVLMATVVVACILTIGFPYAENRYIPIGAPLVPCLSLFGLLNVEVVDGTVGLSFLIFIAASLYLLAYERMLYRHGHRREGVQAMGDSGDLHAGQLQRRQLRTAQLQRGVMGTATHYLVACSAWFAVFILGAIVLYKPLQVLLPSGLMSPLSQIRANPALSFMDWRTTSKTMQLRGGVSNLSNRPVLKVRVNKGQSAGLWRGRTFERYVDSQWEDDSDETSQDPVAIDDEQLTGLPKPHELPGPSIAQMRVTEATVEPVDQPAPTVISSGVPIALQGPWISIYSDRHDNTINIPENYRSKELYIVRAESAEYKLAKLASLPGLSPEQLKSWRDDPFLQNTLAIPDSPVDLRPQLQRLAQQMIAAPGPAGRAARTPYQQVQAINRYLLTTCRYSLTSPPIPFDRDAVVFFLTESRVGACDMFASSTAMLLRSLNIPTRIVTGYLEPDAAEGAIGADGSITIEERNAHAWLEYYVPQAGWIPFDPTEGTILAQNDLQSRLAQMLHLPQWRANWRLTLLPAVGLLLLVVGGVWSTIDLRRSRYQRNRQAGDVNRARITNAYSRALRLLRRKVPRRSSYTPVEYEMAVHRSVLSDRAKLEFSALTYLFVAAQYTAEPPSTAETDLQASLKRLQQDIR